MRVIKDMPAVVTEIRKKAYAKINEYSEKPKDISHYAPSYKEPPQKKYHTARPKVLPSKSFPKSEVKATVKRYEDGLSLSVRQRKIIKALRVEGKLP